MKFPIDDARSKGRRLSCSRRAKTLRKSGDIFAWHATTFLAEHARFVVESNGSIIESAIRPSGSLECSDASLYIREAGGCQWSVYGASSDLNKRSVCKVRGLSIQASTECKKSRRFQTKGDIGLWPSGSLPDARYSYVSLLLHPWKRGWKSEILSEQTRSASKLDVSRMCFFWPLKATCPSSRIACFKLPCSLWGNVKQWAVVYQTTVARFHCDCAFV